jgi:hypothetical protein
MTNDDDRAFAKKQAQVIYDNHKLKHPDFERDHIATRGYLESTRRGLLGERAFTHRYGGNVRTDLVRGDGGIDFILRLRGTNYAVDVKTKTVRAKWTWEQLLTFGTAYLRVPMTKVRPLTIYIFAIYLERTDEAEVLGWCWGHELIERNEQKSFSEGTGEMNLVMPFELLHDLSELDEQQWVA